MLLLLSFWPLFAHGQYRDGYDVQEWHHGRVILASGDSLEGAVVYHPNMDVVQVEAKDGAVSSFSPVNVSHFIVRDTHSGKPHIFRSLFWNQGQVDSDFKKPVFFEQLNHGTISLIKRQIVKGKNDSYAGANGVENYNALGQSISEEYKETYYALLPDGEIVTLRKIQRDLHRLFGDKSDVVRKFARSNKLDYNKPHELVTIVNYFNTL